MRLRIIGDASLLLIFTNISDANEEKRKEELREGAKKELAEWYRHHEEQIAKTKTANRYCFFPSALDVLCQSAVTRIHNIMINCCCN
jgi:DNA phosphorothioation-dependent restriction protein DptG